MSHIPAAHDPSQAHLSSTATAAEPAREPANPRIGYTLAVLYAIISGVAIYVNKRGVGTFSDATLYTTLKNAVVGIAVLVPFLALPQPRREVRRLHPRQWGLLLLVALLGGSVAYALQFSGLKVSTAVTAALIDHTQFLFVAIFAAILLRERFNTAIWLALVVLFIGLSIGITVQQVHWDAGAPLILAATIMLALDFVVIKYLLRSVSIITIMVCKMSLGAALLLAYEGILGHWGSITHLSGTQWGFVLVTGLILLAFTLTTIAGLRHASATTVIAIGAGSPIVTEVLVVVSQHVELKPITLFGLALVLLAVLAIFVFGQRQELAALKKEQAVAA